MFEVTIDLDDRMVRRVNSVIRGAERVLILHTGRELHIINDKGDFFRSLSIPSQSNEELFIECDPAQLKMLSLPGTMKITVEDSKLNLAMYIGEEEKMICIWMTNSVVASFSRFHMQVYLNIIENKDSNIFRIEALSNIKELIASCSATTTSLEITKGLAVTKSNNVIIYQELIDDELSVSFTNLGLKEMDKFKLDCTSSSFDNYVVMFRDDYTLAVKKGVSGSTSAIPSMYMQDNLADFRVSLNMHVLLPMIAELNDKELGGECECIIDLKSSIAHVQVGKMECKIAIPVYENKRLTELDMELDVLKFNLLELKPVMRMMKSTKRHTLFIYKGVIRMVLDNSNVIVRHRVS